MSAQNELTYILGAGASYQSIPVVKTFPERFKDFSHFLHLHTQSNHTLYISNNIQKGEIKNLKNKVYQIFEEFKNHQSFDTYFKKLFHTKNENLIDVTKKVLNYYFLWEHSTDSFFEKSQIENHSTQIKIELDKKAFNKEAQIDKRYDALIAGLLKPQSGNLEMFCKTNFISWNYDINLLASLKNYFSPETTFDEFLNEIKTDNDFIWQIKSAGISVINMNGYFYSDVYGNKKNLNDLTLKDTFSEFNSYLNGIKTKDDHRKIKFAWEENNYSEDIAKQKINMSDNIVVIGYTFPLYNRLIDKTYFPNSFLVKNPEATIYIQDPSAKKNKFTFMNNFNITKDQGNRIIEIEDCDSFFVPSNIHNPKEYSPEVSVLTDYD